MHLCIVALTDICTQKKKRESSFTLCCRFDIMKFGTDCGKSIRQLFDDALDSILGKKRVIREILYDVNKM